MIFALPAIDDAVDQGDIVDGCPIASTGDVDPDNIDTAELDTGLARVIVLTQTCDLAQAKVRRVNVALVLETESLIVNRIFKASDIKGPLRAGRIYGWHFLPKDEELGFPESVIDLRQLHTVQIEILTTLCQRRKRLARLLTPYREHLGKHFGDTFSRIGLPRPYETL